MTFTLRRNSLFSAVTKILSECRRTSNSLGTRKYMQVELLLVSFTLGASQRVANLISRLSIFAHSASHFFFFFLQLARVFLKSLAWPASVVAFVFEDVSNFFRSVALSDSKSLTLAATTSSSFCRAATTLSSVAVHCRLKSHSFCRRAKSLLDQPVASALVALSLKTFHEPNRDHSPHPPMTAYRYEFPFNLFKA